MPQILSCDKMIMSNLNSNQARKIYLTILIFNPSQMGNMFLHLTLLFYLPFIPYLLEVINYSLEKSVGNVLSEPFITVPNYPQITSEVSENPGFTCKLYRSLNHITSHPLYNRILKTKTQKL